MRFYIDKSGVIRWNPKGWPDKPIEKECQTFIDGACDVRFTCCQSEYNFSMARAKAESVPVREHTECLSIICKTHSITNAAGQIYFDSFYEVPDSEIKKEWL